jgi:hypothetical protein
MNAVRTAACAMLLLLAASFVSAEDEKAAQAPDPASVARDKLTRAETAFDAGDYKQARELVTGCIAEHEGKTAVYPAAVIARLYVLDALIAYAFRDEGYAERVDQALKHALALDLDLSIGDPAVIPPFVQERFGALKTDELARYSRTERRSAFGLSCALVLEPTVLKDLSLLQPGLSYMYNLSDSFTLDAEIRFPLQLPLWNSIRGQVGLLWYPSFRVDRICTGVSLFYLFGLDELTTFTHSLSFGGRIDYLSRSGFGVGGNAELVRADLISGSGVIAESPSSSFVSVLGLTRVVFANITLSAYYAF